MLPSSRFWLRYVARFAAVKGLPDAVGPRDQLTYYERQGPWRPEQGLREFIAEIVRDQRVEEVVPRVRAFLDFWLPRQGLAPWQQALIEFSFTTNKPGFGIMLYGDNKAMTQAFRRWSRLDGVDAETADRCAALCETFDDTELATVRAEFRPGDATRLSLSSSWFLDPLRRSGGFAERLARLPEAHRDPALTARVAAVEASLAPEMFPLFIGLSFDGGVLEPKIYFVRYSDEQPLAPGSRATRLVESLAMGDAQLAQVRSIYRDLWAASSERMTQVMVGVSAADATPLRMNLITCGTPTGAVKDALRALGDPRFNARSVAPFERALQSGRAKYVALRITPEGLSPRLKLYGHAMFALRS
jgi:hypothetical protein